MKLKDWEDVGEIMNHNFKEFTRKQKYDYSEYIIIIIVFMTKIYLTIH